MVILPAIGLMMAAAPAFFELATTVCEPEQICPYPFVSLETAFILEQLGLSVTFQAAHQLLTTIAMVLLSAWVATMIIWRRPFDRGAVLTANFLLWFALSTQGTLIAWNHPFWDFVQALYDLLGGLGLLLFFYLFPDGRFVPHWTRWMALVGLFAFGFLVFGNLQLGSGGSSNLGFALLLSAVLGTLVGSLAAQIYRYRRVATHLQRQQTKWVIYGAGTALSFFALGLVIALILGDGSPVLPAYGIIFSALVNWFFLLIPLSVGMAMLRTRLWDIDLFIRRTLIYGLLTAGLALTYFGSVALIQRFTPARSQADIVISTLAIAALFQPLRRRIQGTIDRRFYRRRYDAERILTKFATSLRDEVDPGQVVGGLLTAVAETVQPSHASIWLNETAGKVDSG